MIFRGPGHGSATFRLGEAVFEEITKVVGKSRVEMVEPALSEVAVAILSAVAVVVVVAVVAAVGGGAFLAYSYWHCCAPSPRAAVCHFSSSSLPAWTAQATDFAGDCRHSLGQGVRALFSI